MKAIKIAILSLAVAAGTLSFTTSKEPQKSTESAKQKTVTWKSDVIEVGDIPQGVPYTFKFEFTNNTDKPVLINDVHAQCGCTATDYTKNPVAPKKSGYVAATYNASNPGVFTKTVTVTSTENSTPKTLTLKGKVVAKS